MYNRFFIFLVVYTLCTIFLIYIGFEWLYAQKAENTGLLLQIYIGVLVIAALLALNIIQKSLYNAIMHGKNKKKEATELQNTTLLKQNDQWFLTIFDSVNDGIFVQNAKTGTILDVNQRMCDLFGYTTNEFLQISIGDISSGSHPYTQTEALHWLEKTSTGKSQLFEWHAKDKKGRLFWIEVNMKLAVLDKDQYIIVVVRDIGERKQADEILRESEKSARFNEARLASLLRISQHKAESVKELLNFALDEAIKLTESKVGFIGSYNDEKKELAIASWSKDVMKECAILEKQIVFSVEKNGGILTESIMQRKPVILNDFQAPHPLKKGLPEGHIKILRFLSIPVFSGDKVIATIAVANKLAEYDESDVRQLTLLMDSAWKIVEHKQNEEKIHILNKEIQSRAEYLAGEIKLQKQYAENVLRSIADAVYVVDEEGRITSWNRAAETITGLTGNDVIGKCCTDLAMHRDTKKNPTCLMEKCPFAIVRKAREPIPPFETCMSHRDGHNMVISLSAAPLLNDKNDFVGMVNVFRDISLEIQLRENLNRANKAKSAFVSNISHEIRTPLNAILGFAQVLLRDQRLTAEQKKHINTINKSGEHLLALINDILEISKIEAGHANLNLSSFSLVNLLEDLEMMFRIRTKAKDLTLNIQYLNVPDFITTDENKLRQILINLIGNAVKFTKKGGILVRIDSRNRGGDLYLLGEIQDTGTGIAKEEIEKLFQYFEQTEAGRESKAGTGLGLAISREFARMMGGDITVESEFGKGSIFRFEIKITKADVKKITAQMPSQRVLGIQTGQPSFRVLIVDDTEENRTPLAEILKLVGFEVTEAVNGQDAIEKFHRWHPDIILMDMRMPVMDGYEAITRIKNTERGKAIPIIALTASAFEENRIEILKTGVAGYIRKPFKEDELFSTIGKCLKIQYIYEEKNKDIVPQNEKTEVISYDAVRLLPDEIRQQMYNATSKADIDTLLSLLRQASQYDTHTVEILRSLAEKYEYEKLLELFKL